MGLPCDWISRYQVLINTRAHSHHFRHMRIDLWTSTCTGTHEMYLTRSIAATIGLDVNVVTDLITADAPKPAQRPSSRSQPRKKTATTRTISQAAAPSNTPISASTKTTNNSKKKQSLITQTVSIQQPENDSHGKYKSYTSDELNRAIE